MPELVCPRCKPGSTTLTNVITCIAQGQSKVANPNPPGGTLDMPAIDTDKMRFPYFGKGRSKNLMGAGFVVGFKQEITTGIGANGRGNRWRLDYDPEKGLHVNFESDTAPKMAHRFHRIDAQPFVAKNCPFPDGMSKLGAEEQVKRMWFSWTKFHVAKGKQVSEVQNEMANAYKDIGITTADAFIKRFDTGSSYSSVSDLLTNTKT